MGKTVYAHQIEHDEDIRGTIVRTSTLPEELGRINYLLTDKTGTLTQNGKWIRENHLKRKDRCIDWGYYIDMELKKLHMGTMSYTTDTMDEIITHLASAFGSQCKSILIRNRGLLIFFGLALTGKSRRNISSRIRDIVQALALCHNVTPVINTDGSIAYQASSPDEVAIVKWTEQMGMTLVERDINDITLRIDSTGMLLTFEVLHIFPFTSETKRMGIVIRDKQSKEITFYEKGADVVMRKIVQYNDW
jgi:phospholipid-translocating ATPase